MNKNLFRVIFNNHRGLYIAVSETAHSHCGGSLYKDRKRHTLTLGQLKVDLTALASACCIAIGTALLAPKPVQSQVIAYRQALSNQQPTILQTANGVPQVNIQTPSAAGVSRNAYGQFDIQSNGVILNNSRTDIQTRQGGWVQGNPWLATGSARVILNEITAPNPSHLNGYIEVAGQRAEVVIANPSGISVDGGGFINTSKVTLTTGTPIVNGGSLDGFRVQGGHISILGNGLDLSTTDYAALLARAAQVNAGIWANELKVLTGANQIDASTLAPNTAPIATVITSTETAPSFALDVAQIGGMYAGKIHLIGTEKGLGVRSAGIMAATDGDLVLQNNGWLTTTGTLQASEHLQINTQGDILSSGVLTAGKDLQLATTQNLVTHGQNLAAGEVFLSAGNLDLSRSQFNAKNITAQTTRSLNTANATISANQGISLVANNISNAEGKITAGKAVHIQSASLNNDAGYLVSSGELTIVSNSISNKQGTLHADQDLTLASTGSADNNAGQISAGSNLLIQDSQAQASRTLAITNTNGSLIADKNLNIDTSTLSGDGSVLSSGDVHISLNADFRNANQIIGNHDVNILTSGNINNSGKLQAGNSLQLRADNVAITATGEISANTTQLNANRTLTNRGLIDGSATQINADTLHNLGTGRIYGDHLSIAANNLINGEETVAGVKSAGTLAARDRLDLGIVTTLTNREHALIYSVGDMAIGGALNADRQATGLVRTLNNNSATIEAGRDLSIASTTLNNTNEHFAYEIRVVSVETEVREDIDEKNYRIFTRTTSFPFQSASDPAQILAGGDIQLSSSSTTNLASHILAGGTLRDVASTLANTDVMATKTIHDVGTTYSLIHILGSGICGKGFSINCVREHDEWQTAPYESKVRSTVAVAQETAASYRDSPTQTRDNTIVSTSLSGTAIQPTIPSGSLYKTIPSPTSTYLIETDSRFIDRKLWLGSDYITQQLRLDPSVTQKRLGDGFYEQKLIREQVAALTGRRFLSDYTSDEQQYKALMNSGVSYAKQYNLRLGIALTPQQMVQLTSDIVWLVEQTVTLPDGSSQKVLVPQVYVKVQPGDLDGSGALLSGKDVQFELLGDLTNSGTIAGRQVIDLTAENINNLGGRIAGDDVKAAARQDLTNRGGSISAVNRLSATAERDLTVESTTQTSASGNGVAAHSRTNVDRVAGLFVTGTNGTLIANAARDMNIVAGVVSNAGDGDTQLSAGNNLLLSTVQTGEQNNIIWDSENHLNFGSTLTLGSTIRGGGTVSIQSGNDINATAANVQAGKALRIHADGSVNALASENTAHLDEAHKTTSGGGIFGSATLINRNTSNASTSVANNFGGDKIDITANKDVNIIGSNVLSDNGTRIYAEHDVVIEPATNLTEQSSNSKKSETGFLGGDGLSISYGTRKQSSDGNGTTSTIAPSTVGAINGNVVINANNHYKQFGSDVVAPNGDVSIFAKNGIIRDAREINAQNASQKFEQSGLTLAVTSTVISTVENAKSQIQATHQTSDSRMKALGTASAAANLKMAADALKAGQGDENGMVETGKQNPDNSPELAQANAADKVGGIQVAVSYGQSHSESKQSSQSDTARGSTVKAGGTTTIKINGDGESSDLDIHGSDISGHVLHLEADHKVNLFAAQNTVTQSSTSNNASASVGIAVQLGNRGGGMGISGSVSKGGGNGDSTETTYTNTHLTGASHIFIKSGSDTTHQGAVVKGNQVTADVGGHLIIESLQDTATFAEKSKQVAASGVIGVGATGNINLGKTNITSNYASVSEQSGLQAGDGGFAIKVQGNTDLKGGAITSTEKALQDGKNSFSVGGTLTTSNIENKARYEANSVSIGLGTGGAAAPGQGLAAALNGVGKGSDSASTSSTTTAGISGIAGDISKRTGDNAQGIGKIFDADKVRQEIQAQTKITQEFSKQASAAIASYSDQQKIELQAQIKAAPDADKAALKQQLDQVLLEEKVLNILVGAVTGFGETMVTKESLKAAAEQMREVMIKDSSTFAGVVDSTGRVLSNATGTSEGVNRYGFKLGGTRIDLDKLCGVNNERCMINSDGSLKLDAQKRVQFDAKDINGNLISLQEFLESTEGQKMAGLTGGVQGAEGSLLKGTFMGSTYIAGSWQDKLIETFAGTHDFIGGKLTGLYDDQGNIRRGMSAAEQTFYNKVVTTSAIVPSVPFAAAQGLPPEIWKAVAILLDYSK